MLPNYGPRRATVPSGLGKKMKTVLLVDDEESDRDSIRQILHADGYTALEADSYQHAWAAFETNRDTVDLLIADISLPDGNGCMRGLAIHKHKPDIRVLFVSGHVGPEVCRFFGL